MSKSLTILDDTFELVQEQKLNMSPMTMAVLIAEFVALGEFSSNTREAYKDDLQKLWQFTNGDLSDSSLMRYKLKVIDSKDYAARTSNRMLSSTRQFLDYLVSRKILQTNYFANKFTGKSKKVDKTDSPYVALSSDEVRAMINYPDRSSVGGASQRMALVLGFYAGLRASEISGICHGDITDTFIVIRGKGNKTRKIPLADTLKIELDEYRTFMATYLGTPAPERYLIETAPRFGREMTAAKVSRPDRTTIWRWFTSIAKACGIKEHFSPHSARATAITKALESGVAIRDVANLAGHSSVDTTMIYDKKRGEASLRAVKGIKY